MFTDIAGYTSLMSRDEQKALSILEKNRALQKNLAQKHNGEFLKEMGDGTLLCFSSALDAVRCAMAIQESVKDDSDLNLRIGIHLGDIVFRDGDVFGDGVNVASRIETLAEAGGICFSEEVYKSIRNQPDIQAVFVSKKRLKNVAEPVNIYMIRGSAEKKAGVQTGLSIRYAKIYKIILLTVSGAALAAAAFFLIHHYRASDQPASRKRIVAAIFENRTGDASLDVLGKMAADWITQSLSRSAEADVVPSSTVVHSYASAMLADSKHSQGDYIYRLAAETKADIIISGSYYLHGDVLQFKSEIKNVSDGQLIYSIPALSGTTGQYSELIEKLGNEISGGLAHHIRFMDIRQLSKPPNRDAYIEYFAGLELFGKDPLNAIKHFNRAFAKDSLFVLPLVFIIESYMSQIDYAGADSVFQIFRHMRDRLTPFERCYQDYFESAIKGNLEAGLRYLLEAARIAPSDWLTNYLIGQDAYYLNKPRMTIETYSRSEIPSPAHIGLVFDPWKMGLLAEAHHDLGNYQQALEESRKGQKYYPDLLWFYSHEARALAALGRIEEMEKVIEKCHAVSTISGTIGQVLIETALELRFRGHIVKAREYAERAVEWYRDHTTGEDNPSDLAFALYAAENWQEAKILFEKLDNEYPGSISSTGYLGVLAAHLGDKEKAREISEKLKNMDQPYIRGQHTLWRARIAAMLGGKEEAVRLLRLSLAQGRRYGSFIYQVYEFESLRDYEPFRELMKPRG